MTPPRFQRLAIMGAALLALFLGALDALIMSAAMPTVVSELGGLALYSWVYSAYFLARAVSLPIFGKLADLFPNRRLFLVAIALFTLSSLAAGCAPNMTFLIVARVFQGIGAGGIFALVYIVLADVSAPAQRGRTLSLASSIWGIASVLGPTLGGFLVTYFSWRWVFFINVPLGIVSLAGIGVYLVELREKRAAVTLDWLGVSTLTTAVLAFLFAFLLVGRSHAWDSLLVLGLMGLSVAALVLFVRVERRAPDPILSIDFFTRRGFSTGNGAVFMSSFAIFSLFAFAPLFIQGSQGKSPMEVGLAMLTLSLGWSVGSLALGQVVDRKGRKLGALIGALLLLGGTGMTLGMTAATSTVYSSVAFFVVGLGMGFVSLATLLVVQSSLPPRDLGVATTSNQFARTLGGTVGVGVCGSFIAARFAGLQTALQGLDRAALGPGTEALRGQVETFLRPDIQARMPAELLEQVQQTIAQGVFQVFWAVVVASLLCLLLCLAMPGDRRPDEPQP